MGSRYGYAVFNLPRVAEGLRLISYTRKYILEAVTQGSSLVPGRVANCGLVVVLVFFPNMARSDQLEL